MKLSIEIWPTVGGKSHHLARIFGSFSGGNHHFHRILALSRNMAQLLYGARQV
jgi:hypothetical protein